MTFTTLIARSPRHLASKSMMTMAATALFSLAACSNPPAAQDNAPAVSGEPLAVRPVLVGTEGPSLPACSSLSKVKDGGTDIYWAPNETRAAKASLPAGASVSVCEAAENDQWFGIVFAAPRTEPEMCGVTRSVASQQEYQGPCRSGWIRAGSVRIGG